MADAGCNDGEGAGKVAREEGELKRNGGGMAARRF